MTPLLLLSVLAALASDADSNFPAPQGPSQRVVEKLQSLPSSTPSAELREALRSAAKLLPPQSPVGELLKQGAEQQDEDELREIYRRALDQLTFEPVHEAELPAGFPTYTPPGVIEVKQYPIHRRAEAKEFFTLFSHITTNGIAMTTPVRMEMKPNERGTFDEQSMAFYYGDPSIGKLGKSGSVDVVEEKQQTVVALGQRGPRTRKAIANGERRLRDWIAAHPEYESAGSLLVMGYNSPMISPDQQFFELQIPLKHVEERDNNSTPTR